MTERTAEDHALALVRAVAAHPGAPRLRVWAKPGVGVRVYFPSGDFVSVGRGGDLQETQRGRATFVESNLFPAQRRAYRAGLAAYLRELQAHVEHAWTEGEKTHKAALAQELAEVRRKYPRLSDEDAREMAEFRLARRIPNPASRAELGAYFEAEASRHENPVKRKKLQGDPLFDARKMLGEVRRQREDDEDDGDGPPRILSVEAGQRLYHGEHVSWIGWPGRILKLGWDQVKPRQGNIFYPEKLAHFLGLIRSANAAGKRLRFPAPPAFILHGVDIDDVAERQAEAMHRPDDIAYDNLTRPYSSGDEGLDEYLADPNGYVEKHTFYGDEDGAEEIRADMAERKASAIRAQTGDLGNIVADLRDGNHRAFASQLAGDPYVWVHVVEGEEGDLDRRLLK